MKKIAANGYFSVEMPSKEFDSITWKTLLAGEAVPPHGAWQRVPFTGDWCH